MPRRHLICFLTICTVCATIVPISAQETKPAAKPAANVPAPPAEKSNPAAASLPDLSKVSASDIEKAYEGAEQPEAVKMLLAISKGSSMGANDGWFGPADSRFSFKWLAERQGTPEATAIPKDKFLGEAVWFARLDRNKDGRITPDDLDWSDRNPWVQQAYLVNRIFRRMDPSGDGKVTQDELTKFFQMASEGKDYVSSENLRDALLGGASGFTPGDAPNKEMLIRALFAGEVGSLNEGPKLNAQAPLFALKTHDGEKMVNLADLIGKQPIVLTFGNFTCGPFRSMFPGVEDIRTRFAEKATFLMVYVREAHPSDGWKMESNKRVGVEVAQPKTYAERTAVAGQCHAMLKPTMPLLVDEINDPVGSAYSGPPARMYVIDVDGKVAYKSGRGPFGFKTGEMEQALVMALMERAALQAKPAQPAAAAGN